MSGEKTPLFVMWVFSACAAFACATPPRAKVVELADGTPIASGRSLQVALKIAPEANSDSAVGLAFVVCYEPALTQELLKLTAARWFQERERFLHDHAGMVVEELWELVPGQVVPPIVRPLPRNDSAEGVLFANYGGDGAYRYRFIPEKPLKVTLGGRTVTVAQEDR